MGDPLSACREAIARRVHAVCLDRNLDPEATVDPEANCRIERFLAVLVEIARTVEPNDVAAYEAAVEQRVCVRCGGLDARGVCQARQEAACCLSRYLPLVYDAVHRVRDTP